MGRIIIKKLKSATIVETIVALTILLIIFGIATSLIVNISLDVNSIKELRAEQVLGKFIRKTKDTESYFNEDIKEEEFYIKKMVEPFGGNMKLLQLSFFIYDQNKNILFEQRELILHEN